MATFNRYDDRKDLGYGTINPKFQLPKKMGTNFPYVEPDEFADEAYEDEDTEWAIKSKVSQATPTDSGNNKSIDRAYFVGGNTSLADCFFRVDTVLDEIFSLGDSMSPIPSKGRSKRPSGGSATHSNVYGGTSRLRFGSKRGYFSAPPDDNIEDQSEEENQPVTNLKDLAKKQSLQRGSFSL